MPPVRNTPLPLPVPDAAEAAPAALAAARLAADATARREALECTMTDHPTLTPWGLSLLPEYRGADRPVPDPGHASRPHYEAERDALRARDRELTMVLRYLAMCTASTVYGLGSWALSHCIDRYALRHGWTADATRPQPLDISNGIVLAAVLMSGWEVLPRGRGWLDLPDAPNRLIMLANNFDERRSAYTQRHRRP